MSKRWETTSNFIQFEQFMCCFCSMNRLCLRDCGCVCARVFFTTLLSWFLFILLIQSDDCFHEWQFRNLIAFIFYNSTFGFTSRFSELPTHAPHFPCKMRLFGVHIDRMQSFGFRSIQSSLISIYLPIDFHV